MTHWRIDSATTFKASSAHKTPWIETPLIESTKLSKSAGCRIFLKLENLQPSGSFKSRGIGNLLVQALRETPTEERHRVHFFCSSGGNAGLACAYAAKSLGHPATIVVPLSTKPMMLEKIRAAGAEEVLQCGATWLDADIHMRDHVIVDAERRGALSIYVPPFDHPDVWAGASTIIAEADAQLTAAGVATPDVVICSVGGGGLFNGLVQGMQQCGWDDTEHLALETVGADALNASLEAGEHLTLPGITSIATSLGAKKVSAKTYELATTRDNIKSAVLTDAEATMGAWRFADDERILVEPACGVNLAMCYDGRLSKALGREVQPDDKVMIVVCGGSGVTLDMLAEWKTTYGPLL